MYLQMINVTNHPNGEHYLKQSQTINWHCNSVLVSQWTSFLDIIEKHVRKAGFTFVRIDGR